MHTVGALEEVALLTVLMGPWKWKGSGFGGDGQSVCLFICQITRGRPLQEENRAFCYLPSTLFGVRGDPA